MNEEAQQALHWRPKEFAGYLLEALEASEGRRKRRKRNTTPDAIGLQIKRELLRRVIEDDPDPEAFEGWLLHQSITVPASGPVHALCIQIFEEYRVAHLDSDFIGWLAAGAPSADRE